jgi:ATP-dependent DNA helicase RecG
VFANTKGGQLFVGIDDTGTPKGIKDRTELLEDLTNKIKESLGIVPSVECKKKNKKIA